jgi:hypothetical protein
MKIRFVVSGAGDWNSHMGSLRLNRVCDWLHATMCTLPLLGSHRSQLDLSLSLSFSLGVFALPLFQALPQQGPKLTIGAWPKSQAMGSPKSTKKISYFPYTVQCACFLTSRVRSRDFLIHVDISYLPYKTLKFCGNILKGPSFPIMEDSLVKDNSFIIDK